jgi:signal transduction histidine kinase/CheY-like chemotaxis protein
MTELETRPIGPVTRRMLAVVAAGHLRYWIIGSWAVALVTAVPWPTALIWYGITTALGLLRGLVDRPVGGAPRLRLAVATVSCIAWAVAPLLVWFSDATHGEALAIGLLCAGFTLVFTQMRASPKEALIVSSPYSLVVLLIILSLWGQPGFWQLMAVVPVLGLAMVIKLMITLMKDNEIAAVVGRQRELIADLKQARDQAQAANEAKSSFLGIISHELRTPMNGVLGAAQLLEGRPIGEVERSYVSMIRTSGEGLLALLNDILDVTKMEAGRLDLRVRSTPTTEVWEQAVRICRAQAEARDLALEVDLRGEIPHSIATDPLRVGQILTNLLGNAVKFTDVGAVRLTITGERLADESVRLSFAVADTGPGISEADQARLFQPFTQLDTSSTRRASGTGLGLTISRRLAHMLAGEIIVASRAGEGATFTFIAPFPVQAWKGSTSPEMAAAPSEEIVARRVLVVEDHPVNRLILETWLTGQGHSVFTAENGEIALEMAAKQAFDIIVMDVNMPVMDGLTATRRIRGAAGANRNTPIIILSASARPEDLEHGWAAGADSYVVKPVDFARLSEVLGQAGDGRDALRRGANQAA